MIWTQLSGVKPVISHKTEWWFILSGDVQVFVFVFQLQLNRHWVESTIWCGDRLSQEWQKVRGQAGVGRDGVGDELGVLILSGQAQVAKEMEGPPLAGEVVGTPMGLIRVDI